MNPQFSKRLHRVYRPADIGGRQANGDAAAVYDGGGDLDRQGQTKT